QIGSMIAPDVPLKNLRNLSERARPPLYAQPMRLGQLFGGYASLTERLAAELVAVRDKLRTLPLGGTAIGTGFGAPAGYRPAVYSHLQGITGVDYQAPANPFDAMQNMDGFSRVA
ncbi:lyase family protein, partial [Burkholderia sp. SIMBA_062]|uniref:lyase family protein n=1 Tax=Burkholderia sp. SIMBA_062 TaxID=3085803 RepID=UPI0039789162